MPDLGPNQLAWLRENIAAFEPAEKQAIDARRHSREVERKLKATPGPGGAFLRSASSNQSGAEIQG
jgi:hypothetical protein